MIAADYVVLFSIAERPFHGWMFALMPLIAGAVMAFALVVIGGRIAKLLALFAAGAGIYGSFETIAYSKQEYEYLLNAFRTGQYESVEGRVENFIDAPPYGSSTQTFEVEGRVFTTTYSVNTSAFNHPARFGGPRLEGRRVRILFKDENKIIWLGLRRRLC